MGNPTRPPPSRRRRWAVRLAVVAAVAVGLFAARRPLLRGVAAALVIDEPGGPADAVFPETGAFKLEEAARLYRAGEARRVLLGPGPPERVAAVGVIPDKATGGRRQLTRLGVPDDAITTLGKPDQDVWDSVRRLGDWLRGDPGATAVLVCERYAARRTRVIADRLLGPDAARVRVRPLPSRRFTDADWWRHEDGRREVVVQSIRLMYTLVAGGRTAPYPEWNPDAYEAALK